jgi:hypothetical protein
VRRERIRSGKVDEDVGRGAADAKVVARIDDRADRPTHAASGTEQANRQHDLAAPTLVCFMSDVSQAGNSVRAFPDARIRGN